MAASSTAASKVFKLHHQTMRMMTGAMKSMSNSAMEAVTGVQLIKGRQDIKVLTQTAKFNRLQDHLMHKRMDQPTRERLKRSSFIQHGRIE